MLAGRVGIVTGALTDRFGPEKILPRGAAIIAVDETLKARGAKFRTPVLACAVGIYLPLELTVPIFAGGLMTHLVERKMGVGNDESAKERIHRKGTLFSAGLITGEALMGIFRAIPIVR